MFPPHRVQALPDSSASAIQLPPREVHPQPAWELNFSACVGDSAGRDGVSGAVRPHPSLMQSARPLLSPWGLGRPGLQIKEAGGWRAHYSEDGNLRQRKLENWDDT